VRAVTGGRNAMDIATITQRQEILEAAVDKPGRNGR
jgi:hypothetical protein